MSKVDQSQQRRRLLPPEARPYEVGYAKPPVTGRFKPGQSGNPNGRRKGPTGKNVPPLNEERLKQIILEEAYRSITINDPNGQIDIPMAQAVVRSLAVNAAKGNQRAQRLFTQLLSAVERDNRKLHDEWLETAINYKVEWDRELERRTRLGITAPDPVPHPDHVIIDMNTGSVRITGPMTKEEQMQLDAYGQERAEALKQVENLKTIIGSDPHHPERMEIETEIRNIEATFAQVDEWLKQRL